MKKLFIASIISILGIGSLTAQNNIIKVNLLSPIVRTGSFFYERVITDKTSAQLGFYFTAFGDDDFKYRGYGITPEFRFYPGANAGNGFYIAPFLRYQNITLSSENEDLFTGQKTKDEATLTTFGGGLLAGRQWLFGDIISLDIFIGPCLNAGDVELSTTTNPEAFESDVFSGFGVRTGVTIGIAF